jgi:hypothetical protein
MKIIKLSESENIEAIVNTIGIVDTPAIKENMLLFKEEKPELEEDIDLTILEGLMELEFESSFKTVFLISCSSSKSANPAKARDLYISPLFQKSLEYSLKKAPAEQIHILSAKYHLVGIDQEIKPYDLTLKDFSAEDNQAWADKVFEQLKEKYDIQNDRFIFLSGGAYTKYLLPKFSHSIDFLEGKRIGERLQYLGKFYIATNNAPFIKFTSSFSDYVPQEVQKFQAIGTEDKMEIVTPIMVADTLIDRIDENGEMYQVYFDAEGIAKLAHKYITKFNGKMNLDHDPNKTIEGMNLVESWIVESSEQDKSALYGYNLPKGSWFGIFKTDDFELWSRIKNGDYNGVSVEYYQIKK